MFFKKMKAITIDLLIIMVFNILVNLSIHYLLGIGIDSISRSTGSLISTGYLVYCLLYLDDQTFGMKLLGLKFYPTKENINIGFIRMSVFYAVLGCALILAFIGIINVGAIPSGIVGYLFLVIASINLWPKFISRNNFYLHEYLSRVTSR